MLRQILVGAAVSVCNIAIHAFLMAAVIWAARIAGAITTSRQSLRLIAVMIATVSFLMAAHFAEVLVWSLAYAIVGAAPEGTDLIYFAFVNYTTLGYGDVTPVERWHLLGPMTAMNGVLLFGWSTAVIFEVLRRVMTTSQRGRTKMTCKARQSAIDGQKSGNIRRGCCFTVDIRARMDRCCMRPINWVTAPP